MSQRELMELGAALAQPDKTKCDVICVIDESTVKTGAKSVYHNCKVSYNGARGYLNIFGNAPTIIGRPLILRGAEVNEYPPNSKKMKLTLGQYGKIEEYHSDLEPAPTPQKPTQARPAAPAHTSAPPAPQHASNAVHGATACWAVGKAVEMYIAGKAEDIEMQARDLLAIQQRIESGAPSESVPF